MDAALLFPSKYLKAADFKRKEVTLTVVSVTLEDLAQEGGGTKTKGIVTFRETKKAWVLNRTNASCVIGMFGRETDNWVGKRVTLWPAPFNDPFGGDNTECIRVRGSPDLEKDTKVEIRLPRKKPIRALMKKTTGKKAIAALAPEPEMVEEEIDEVTGEVLEGGELEVGAEG